ncbi:MAG TPA: aspartyl/asparaginyl beta-hydroxylase domain-containing protein [Sphingomicrobium sp.]|nr:aspartyl/asparaginyl beta-hydroxylase domain-containing protein [Sphingomicrobium sp.]
MNQAGPGADLKAMLARGDDYAARGDVRAAVSFYQSALGSVRDPRLVDPQTLSQLQRAQAFVIERAREFQATLEQAVEQASPADPAAAIRLSHSLAMLKGERRIYHQSPSVFHYPYLAQRQFFERDEFDWVEDLEAATPAIREELLALLEEGVDFRPYVENDPNRPHRDFHGLNENKSWTALYLWRDSQIVEENARRCPETMAALDKVPLSAIGKRTPAVLFSRLEPGAHIPPHAGMLNCRLICHLPLVVPEGCWLRVGNETRQWEEGKLLIFDDSMEHEAKNPADKLRVILLFDIWRPEIGEEERSAISAIFEAIDRFQGVPEG